MAALIIQNGDIYEDQLGPKYEPLKAYWDKPTPQARQKLVDAVSEEGFRHEFVARCSHTSSRASVRTCGDCRGPS